jgi:hypothetical protein
MRTQKLATVMVVALMAAAATACSGDDEPSAKKSPDAAESVDPANVSPSDLPKVPKVKKPKGAINDLTLGDCETDAGRQTVTGELTSSAEKQADFLVTISWTTGSSDVMGRGFAVLRDVEPGATEEFEIEAKVAKGATQCVPGVVYGTVG